jgi:hypothetical protein
MRFCACVREISKRSQVSPKARHTRRLLLLKKSCHEELLRFYAWQNARHCSRAHATTTSRLGTSALQPPLHRCVSAPGKIRCCSHVCTAATSRPGTSAMQPLLRHCVRLAKCPAMQPCVCHRHVTPGDIGVQPPLRRCILTPGKTLALQPCVRRCHVTPGDIGLLHLDAPAAVCAPPPRHARGHRHCSRRCTAAS